MLLLINEPKNRVHIFYDYSSLYNHIEVRKKQKYARKDNKRKAQSWIFVRHSCQRMAHYQEPMRMVQTAGSQRDGTFSKS
jgi:hypothetical protein